MRQEFTKRTKFAAWNRCGGKCEKCGSELKAANRPEYDHVLPCGLGGDNSLDNCQVLGHKCCHRGKTRKDVGRMRKADRAGKKQAGIRPRSAFKNARGGKYKTRLTSKGPVTVLRD